MKINYLILTLLIIHSWGIASTLCAENAIVRPPAEWLDLQKRVWQDNGFKTEQVFPDVIAALNPGNGEKEYFVLSEDSSPITRETWRGGAFAGRCYPDARRPFSSLAAGAMLYDSNPHLISEKNNTSYEVELSGIFSTLKKLGLNSLVLCTYATPEEWPTIEKVASSHGIKLIVQHHGVYFKPERGQEHFYSSVLPRALDFLQSCSKNPQLLGFAVKEEPYLNILRDMQLYHFLLKKQYPEIPIYTLYNSTEAMTGTEDPASEIMGTDIYPFLGGYFGGGRQTPTFLSPQKALLSLSSKLKERSHEALLRGAVFTYTPTTFGGFEVNVTGKLKEKNIPDREFPGVMHFKNGFSVFWRRYAPPVNAMRASVWLATAYGSQGTFPWYYQPKLPWLKEKSFEEYTELKEIQHDRTPDCATTGSDNSPVWHEYSSVWDEIRKHEKILLQIRTDGIPRFETKDDLLIGRSFRFVPDKPGNAIILVNLDVGRWQDYPGIKMSKPFNLDVNRKGELTGYTPLNEPRTVKFNLRVKPDEIVYSIGEKRKLTPISSGKYFQSYELPIKPGSGEIILICTPEIIEKTLK